MTIAEMREHADRALKYFFQTMPDVPFEEDDIIIDFAPPSRMFARYKVLCQKYRPRYIIPKEHEEQLANSISGQAIIGEGKSAILICTKQPLLKASLPYIIFHELIHIYCAKIEIDGEHFFDLYGNETPYEADEILHDGYYIWSEFIADYYASKYTRSGQFAFESVRNRIIKCLEKDITTPKDNRRDFVWACLDLITMYEAETILNRLTEPDIIISGESTTAQNLRSVFNDCVQLLYRQIQKEKPYKITEDFIVELGDSYNSFETVNTLYRCEQMGGIENAMQIFASKIKTKN